MANLSQKRLRPLRIEEDAFVRALLGHAKNGAHLLDQLKRARVSDMDDGGMGSIEFEGETHRSIGVCLVRAEYMDVDGCLVSIVLNADKDGRLYELDMWKVDFSPIRRYPAFEHVTIEASTSKGCTSASTGKRSV